MKEVMPQESSAEEWDTLEAILSSIAGVEDANDRLLYLENKIEEYTSAKNDIENALVYSNPQLEPQWREEIQGLRADIEEYERWHDAIIDMMEEKGWIPQIPKKE